MFDTLGSKEAFCGTPFSQASTAPSTPFRFHLDDPAVKPQFGFFRQQSAESGESEEAPPTRKLSSFRLESDDGIVEADETALDLESDLGMWSQKHVDIEKAASVLGSELGQWAEKNAEIVEAESTVLDLKSDLWMWAQKHVDIEKAASALGSELGQWAEKHVEIERAAVQLSSELGQWAQNHVALEAKILCLQSELGEWAQKVIEEPFCIGLPPLKSELGQRAENLVKAEEWLKAQMPPSQAETFLVDNCNLQVGTSGLAYRKSKCVEDRVLDVEGPSWGTEVEGVDEGDGWLKVGNSYLPMVLEGMCVLTPNLDSVVVNVDDFDEIDDLEAMYDGAALTPDGRVVDLDGGSPIFFSCEAALTSSHSCKQVTINAAKASKIARAIQAASDVEAEEACSIDLAGVVRGGAALSPATDAAATAKRLKLFHKKRNRQRSDTMASKAPVLCVDAGGKACVFLYLADKLRSKRLRAKRLRALRVMAHEEEVGVVSIDANGVIQYRDEE
jgi:hypothetical protein